MNLTDIMSTSAGLIVILFTLIQISPLKLDPWTLIGNVLNKGLNEKIDKIGEKVDTIDREAKQNKVEEARYRILRFADEIRLGTKHSEEHFNQILSDITCYKKYCSDHPDYKNEKAVNSIDMISTTYRKCLKNNDF